MQDHDSPIPRSARSRIGAAHRAAACALLLLLLSLAACGDGSTGGDAAESPSAVASDSGASSAPDAGSTDDGTAADDGGSGDASDDGGTSDSGGVAPDDGDDEEEYGESDGQYLYLPVPGNATRLDAQEIQDDIAMWFEGKPVTVSCPDGLALDEQIVCEGQVEDPELTPQTTRWDVALVGTVGDGTVLIVRAPDEDAAASIPVLPGTLWAGAYTVGDADDPEDLDAALEESFAMSSGTEARADVDVEIDCAIAGGEHDSVACTVTGDVPAGAVGLWTGEFHPSFYDQASQVVLTKDIAS